MKGMAFLALVADSKIGPIKFQLSNNICVKRSRRYSVGRLVGRYIMKAFLYW